MTLNSTDGNVYGLDLVVKRQPDDLTCGPTCLYSVYKYYRDQVTLDKVIDEVSMLPTGGTLASHLGIHALKNGYSAQIWSFNLNIFDPTWFHLPPKQLIAKLQEQRSVKRSKKLKAACLSYIKFLRLGGQVRFDDLTAGLLARFLKKKMPIIVGLSATYLYKWKREIPSSTDFHDVKGVPSGHFVVLTAIDKEKKVVRVADPYHPNPVSDKYTYEVAIDHLICAILLGVVTYDANLLILERADSHS